METKSKMAVDPPKRKQYSAPALEKGLDVLELLSGEAEGLNISGIAQRLGRSVGELFRMLVVLEQRGYVMAQPSSDFYTLTLKMFELSHRFPPVKRLTTIAGPVLKRLSMEIEQSCHLVIYYEGKGHVVVQQDSPADRVFSVKLGAEAPLIDTCSGHVLLAYADEFEREDMLNKIPSTHRVPKKGEINKRVARIKEHGFESISSGQIQGVQDVGYPIFDHTKKVIAVLVVPFLAYLDSTHSIKIDTVKESLRRVASELSGMLGYELQ